MGSTFHFGYAAASGGGGIPTTHAGAQMYLGGPRDDVSLGLGTALALHDNSDGTVSTQGLGQNVMYVKKPWGSPIFPSPVTNYYSFSFNNYYGTGAVVSVGQWWDLPYPTSMQTALRAMNPFYNQATADAIFTTAYMGSYNQSSSYSRGSIVSYYNGSTTQYWFAPVDIGQYQYPSQWNSFWQQLQNFPGIFVCNTTHISLSLSYWMWGNSGTNWTQGEMMTDGMYYYKCASSYTQSSGDSYPYMDSTHWTQVSGYSLSVLLSDPTESQYWNYHPFLMDSSSNDINGMYIQYQLSFWLQFGSSCSFLGHSDWHVTNAEELMSIMDFSAQAPRNLTQAPGTVLTSTPWGSYGNTGTGYVPLGYTLPSPGYISNYFLTLQGMEGFMYATTNQQPGYAYLARNI